jgi:GNAT superfamily N-acetyltransferase
MDHADAEWPVIRTAVPADLPELQRVFTAAALSNAGDAPLLLARPEFLVFAGEGIADGRTRVAVTGKEDDCRVLGFATVTSDGDGDGDGDRASAPDLEDLFVDPGWRRRGIARRLILDAVRTARRAGHSRLTVTGNPHALAFYLAVGFVEIDHIATELGSGPRLLLDLTRA